MSTHQDSAGNLNSPGRVLFASLIGALLLTDRSKADFIVTARTA